MQQLREAIPSDHSYRFLIHDRDAIFSAEVDQQLKAFGLRVLHTPARAPKANAYNKHSFPQDCEVVARMVLGGLHHEYRWEKIAA